MALRLGELVAYLRADNSHFDRGIDSSRRRLRELAREFERTGNRGLLGDIDRERARLNQLERAAGELGAGGLASARSAMSSFGSVATNVGSNLWNLIPVFVALAAAAAFTVPAVGLLGGALGSLPALSVGVGAGIGALVLGFMGLSDQFKKTSSAGGAVVDKAYQIAQAERRVRDANREVLAAQEALTRARETAAKRIDDLNRSMANARLDERSAVEAVADAEMNLDKARKWGGLADVAKAQLAYDQAAQSLDDVRARLRDMEAEQQRNAREGVAGSDEVKAALERQQKATEGVADAQHALNEARKPQAGGGGGAAEDIMAIAPNAAAAVAALKALKPAFDDLRLSVQQRLFAGVADEIKALANAWLPMLRAKLGQSADTANSLFKQFSSSVRKPEFIERIGQALDAVDRQVDKVGDAVAGPFVDAFGRLAAAASPFLDAVGDELAGLVTDFSNWIKKADDSGALKDFFKQAGDFFHDVVGMGKDVGGIIGDIVKALFDDPANSKGGSTWESLKKTLDDLKAWFDDPENQKKIQDWFQQLQWFGKAFLTVAGWVSGLILWLDDLNSTMNELGWQFEDWGRRARKSISDFVSGAGEQWDRFIGWVQGLPGRVWSATRGMWDGISSSFRGVLNNMIWMWNGLSFTLPAVDWGPVHIGGGRIGVPHIPYLADGGVVRATPGGRLAMVGEGGKDEAVIPLDRLAGMLGGSQRTTRVVAESDDDLLSLLFRAIRWKVVGEYGGSVESAFAGK